RDLVSQVAREVYEARQRNGNGRPGKKAERATRYPTGRPFLPRPPSRRSGRDADNTPATLRDPRRPSSASKSREPLERLHRTDGTFPRLGFHAARRPPPGLPQA